jgi:hypothetical protein
MANGHQGNPHGGGDHRQDCPGCARRIKSVAAFGVWRHPLLAQGQAAYPLCTRCASTLQGSSENRKERLARRIERRLAENPARYGVSLRPLPGIDPATIPNIPVLDRTVYSQADRQWFQDHPDRTYRLRNAGPEESTAHRLPALGDGKWFCITKRIDADLRARRFFPSEEAVLTDVLDQCAQFPTKEIDPLLTEAFDALNRGEEVPLSVLMERASLAERRQGRVRP